MGIFSKFLQRDNEINSLTNEESLIGIIVSITAADGDISDEEMTDLKSIINKSKTISTLDDKSFSSAVDKVFRVLRNKGVNYLLELSIVGLNENLHEGLFCLACDLAYSDGYIEKAEENILEILKEKFNISDENAINIVKVITIKNNV